ncbi:DUF2057 family protein [Vibrio brasiliensis]|uniref:DUF2057 family protein n=1 Tax=Vibrio brasiliensis TaxID=170652 RepID=UPI001EFC5211|nr:DUF2057 family protein [Vibrio brasiliensis]MCG9726010.1 DUF2057 domain-containing protein [Vibrio brasiliensis]
MKQLFAAVALVLVSSMANAQVTIHTDNRVEILAVNQQINQIPKKAKGDLKIANGHNQVLLRVTAMVDGNGGKQKFNSNPMVVTFDASNETLLFETPFAIRDQRGVRKFEKQPTVKVTRNGQPVTIITEQIFNQSFALIHDYDAMLEEYNLAGGVAAVSVETPTLRNNDKLQSDKVSKQDNSRHSGAIQSDFLSMSPAERQEFISWAVKHIND